MGRHAGGRAWVLIEDEGATVTVSIRDEGPGIPAGRLAEAAAQGRLGVTQSIRGRVADLGGTVRIVSAPEAGTEIELSVPRCTAVNPIRVMVVDDHPMWREGVARDLTEAGFLVVATSGEGRQAIRVAAAARPDVVVLDLQLPDISGVEVILGLRAALPAVRVLMLSRPAANSRACWTRSRPGPPATW